MRDRYFKTALLVSALAALTTANALAQNAVRIKGKFKSATSPTQFTIDDDKNVPLDVVTGPTSQLVIEGTAERDFLGPGVTVEFTADMKKGGLLVAPLTQITVCSITTGDPLTFGLDDPTKPSKKGANAINKYLVRGTIKTFKLGKLTIQAPGQMVKGELAEDAKILVKVADATWAQPGDEVDVNGTEGQPGTIRARTAKIKLSSPVAPKDPKKRGK